MSGALLYGDPLFAELKGLFGLFGLLLDFNADILSVWLGFYNSKKFYFFPLWLCQKVFKIWENRNSFV